MEWQALADALFPRGHTLTEKDNFLSGSAQSGEQTIAVVGTTGHAPIGVEIALAQARFVLATVREHPGRPILMLVDTQGQRLRHRDEMLGINSYMAHLGKCVELARRQGHKVIALVYDQALSGGFITSGLMADACYALPDATIRVMGLPAMARITKVPEERLIELAASNPVFAPGAGKLPAHGRRAGNLERRPRGAAGAGARRLCRRRPAQRARPGARRAQAGAARDRRDPVGQRCSRAMTWSG